MRPGNLHGEHTPRDSQAPRPVKDPAPDAWLLPSVCLGLGSGSGWECPGLEDLAWGPEGAHVMS